jgi:hypothetical protein
MFVPRHHLHFPSPHQIEAATVHPRSPPTSVSITSPNGLPTDSELTILLSRTYREIESLKRDISTTRKRAELSVSLIPLPKSFPKARHQADLLTAL